MDCGGVACVSVRASCIITNRVRVRRLWHENARTISPIQTIIIITLDNIPHLNKRRNRHHHRRCLLRWPTARIFAFAADRNAQNYILAERWFCVGKTWSVRELELGRHRAQCELSHIFHIDVGGILWISTFIQFPLPLFWCWYLIPLSLPAMQNCAHPFES